ncbi:MAG TPA: carbohydrate kinase family protein [Solirubrobacteraceae bacterium]|nr:carbohydrate kinase family protein [Solirubrobacteraceae bacterium]
MSGGGSSRRRGVTVIGGVQADVVISPVTELPTAGATRLLDQMSIRVGGAGANAALAFVETGLPVRLMGCVGEDRLGDWMRQELTEAGLLDELAVLPGRATGLTVALESEQRDRTFLTHLGVNADWVPDMIPSDALECDSLLLCDYSVTPGLQGEAARSLLQATRGAGGRTFFDTAWDPDDFPPARREEVRALLSAVDVFLPNEAEACAIAGAADGEVLEAARILQRDCGGWVVGKLGARGCLAVGPGGAELRASAHAVTVADTTGAGDAFNAVLVSALSGGDDWPAALEAATRFATEIVSRPSHDRWRPRLLDSTSAD